MAVAAYFPVPVIVTVCLLPFALSVIVSVPVCFIGAPGVNVTEIVQKEPAARVAGIMVRETRALGLSLGDRACLALGLALKAPVYTADKSWKNLKVGVKIQVIR